MFAPLGRQFISIYDTKQRCMYESSDSSWAAEQHFSFYWTNHHFNIYYEKALTLYSFALQLHSWTTCSLPAAENSFQHMIPSSALCMSPLIPAEQLNNILVFIEQTINSINTMKKRSNYTFSHCSLTAEQHVRSSRQKTHFNIWYQAALYVWVLWFQLNNGTTF